MINTKQSFQRLSKELKTDGCVSVLRAALRNTHSKVNSEQTLIVSHLESLFAFKGMVKLLRHVLNQFLTKKQMKRSSLMCVEYGARAGCYLLPTTITQFQFVCRKDMTRFRGAGWCSFKLHTQTQT